MQHRNKPRINITLEDDVLQAIEIVCNKTKINRSKLINDICKQNPMIKEHITEVKKVKTEEIARVCHQTIKAYRETINDNKKYPEWKETSQDQKESAYDLVNFVVENIKTVNVKKIHDFRRERKKKTGWKIGEKKDYDLKTDPLLETEYENLSSDDKRKSELFLNIVKALIT
ncbi:MAG: hypothetical protein OMM_08356 [Candidatus Magnetoglobus multicellularis str. Araruama]|uniref:Uncharacterized protein n=1 Tax=Candidatus Magnetoglobus multicellularis str. Araruama TaxID=890399 RepID=A0A1V1P853_9BACT|nr:MAG: hypothetical protein OMM_08356 [Candidatus Magnetoglobus multicellularis str. Araruama]